MIAVVAIVFLGTRLAGLWPRDVEVRYLLDPGVVALEVDYERGGEAVASARFQQANPENTVIDHTVRLQPGTYEATITIYGSDGRGRERSRALRVPSEGVMRFDLKEGSE